MNSDWWVEGGATLGNGGFVRNKMMKEKEINKFRFRHNNKGVFVTIYKYDSTDQKNANLLADFYLDIDNSDITLAREDTLEAIKYLNHSYGIDSKYLKIYFSGRKGFHIIVPHSVFSVEPCKDLNRIYRNMAEEINNFVPNKSIDLKIYDKRRLLRLPNSLHPDTMLYKICLSHQELKEAQSIEELAKNPRLDPRIEIKSIPMASIQFQRHKKAIVMKKPVKATVASKPLDYVPPCIQTLLEDPVKEGGRNSAAAALASFYRQNGLSTEQAKSKIEEWNTSKCDPSMSDYEIANVIRSMYNGEYKLGCTWLSSIVDCKKEECKLYRR